MNARTFGKKGTAGSGETAVASRRAAFLAQERARADGESRAGIWHVVTGSWNNPDAPLEQQRFIGLVARAVQLAAD